MYGRRAKGKGFQSYEGKGREWIAEGRVGMKRVRMGSHGREGGKEEGRKGRKGRKGC